MTDGVIRYEVRDPEVEARLREIAKLLAAATKDIPGGRRYGFMLMIFCFDAPETFYMSNANRDDVVQVLKDWIDHTRPAEGNA
jgi:hypothetical protein